MDIKTTTSVTKTSETSNSTSSASATATATKDSSTSFKDELEAAKTQDTKDADKKAAETKTTQDTQKNADEKAAQEVSKNEAQSKKDAEATDNKKISDPIKELNAQLATLNGIKGVYNPKTNNFELKAEEPSTKKDYSSTLKMDNKDINFFVNLVANQQMTAQSAQLNNAGLGANNGFNEIKSEATEKTVNVSATLMDAINQSVKTNQPFRIDFGNDVAVIMKVNKDGQLSANFIPGSAAVEQYLRNNIETLRQSFNEQNLPYDRLSYSRQQNKEQNQNQNKENDNE
jgi:hypothetical protein